MEIAHDPDLRLREIAVTLGLTERSVFAIVRDLNDSGVLETSRVGRRNSYRVTLDAPLPDMLGSTGRQLVKLHRPDV